MGIIRGSRGYQTNNNRDIIGGHRGIQKDHRGIVGGSKGVSKSITGILRGTQGYHMGVKLVT